MIKITPFLWYDNQAKEAAEFYLSIFPNSKILELSYYPNDSEGNAGQVMTIRLDLDGNEFVLFNGGPLYKFSYATSFYVNCKSQEEIDHYWEKLSEDGQKIECGWLVDKYGVPWQIVPEVFGKLVTDPDKKKAEAVVSAMLKMTKFIIADLLKAYSDA
jgi:predicted 3-demethylubiquinone-9 3-methyltransferase (glyoxalase superfamily)